MSTATSKTLWKHMKCFSNNMHSTRAELLRDAFAAFNLSKISRQPVQRVTHMLSMKVCGIMSRVHGANSLMNGIWRICCFLSKQRTKLSVPTHMSQSQQLSSTCNFEGCPCGPCTLVNWVHACRHGWLQPHSFMPQEGVVRACLTGRLSRTALRSTAMRLLPPLAALVAPPPQKEVAVIPYAERPATVEALRRYGDNAAFHLPGRQVLAQHCALCNQWITSSSKMKQQFRLSHADIYQEFMRDACNLCSKFNSPSSPCPHWIQVQGAQAAPLSVYSVMANMHAPPTWPKVWTRK